MGKPRFNYTDPLEKREIKLELRLNHYESEMLEELAFAENLTKAAMVRKLIATAWAEAME